MDPDRSYWVALAPFPAPNGLPNGLYEVIGLASAVGGQHPPRTVLRLAAGLKKPRRTHGLRLGYSVAPEKKACRLPYHEMRCVGP